MPKPRSLGKPGLSIVDANQGRLITYQDDVLGVKREIESRWAGQLTVTFDKENLEWVIIEHCADGTDRLCFTTKTLSQGTIDRINRADQTSRSHVDPNKVYEEMDKEEQREKDRTLSEKIGDASDRLYHALRKDGFIHRPQIHFFGKKAS